ncbi:MAG: FAD-dependent oxidoreductase, partial [Acetomicrobium flavidum]|uniref:FAD-dependent oxidoreductase n=1 Tax=Acetomicrobium flavidum TaxID=49896 RepID=UPI00169592DE|nr:FAD-dependent oxidoreductase [Acetomicrobium flavidum]
MADLTVIGGGPGGYVAAIRAAQLGCNVRLIEREKVGGTCLNRGCIPTKVLLHAAELKGSFDKARDYGFSVKEASLDWKVLMDRKDATVKQLTDGVATLLESWGVEVIYGEASFVNSKEIVVKNGNGTSNLRSDSFIIATGSKPALPPIEGLQCRNVLTSDDALQIQEIPS